MFCSVKSLEVRGSITPLYLKIPLFCTDAIKLAQLGAPLTSDKLEDGGWINKKEPLLWKVAL